MSEALRKLEATDGLITNLAQVTESKRLGYFKHILNVEFVDTFLKYIPDVRKLQEFVYGIDCLTEISRSSSFPSGRLLNNIDINEKAAGKFNELRWLTRDQSFLGCQVGAETTELITEFFSYEYPRLFGELFDKSRLPFATFALDGVWYHLTFNRSFNKLRTHSAIKLTSADRSREVYLPFLRTRTGV
jgi:hypothetical protein